MFGNSFGNANQNQPAFGAQQPKPNTGFFSQATTSPFTQNASTSYGQSQNASPFAQNTGGQGLFPAQQQQPQQGGGIFGASNQNQGGGIFGSSNPQTGGQGLFGGQQQSGNPGIFGNQQPQASNVFGGGQQQGNQTGIFGQSNQQPQQPGIFGGIQSNNSGGQTSNNPPGQGIFGPSSSSQGVGIFGQSNTNPPNTSPFGTAANTSNQSFLGNQGNAFQKGTTGIFGPNQNQGNQGIGLFVNAQQPSTSPFGTPNQGTNIFGGNTQQQQQPNTGGNPLFGTFANAAQNPTTNAFGALQTSNNLLGQNHCQGFGQPQAGFGQSQTAFNPNASINNKLGGTSWGVPTNPVGGTQQAVSVQPVRSKNPKLDNKHLIKCIAALDQFQGLSKEQLRVNFIQTGGQQPTISQQPVAGFKPVAQTTTPSTIPSIPSFGGSQNLGTSVGTNLFGGNQAAQQPNLFNKTPGNTPTLGAFGATQPQNPLFGGANQQQPNTIFGATNQQQPNTMFGAANQQQFNPNPLFGANNQQQPNSMFGAPTQQQQPSTLFGAPNQQQPNTLFNQQQPNTLFGAPNQNMGAQQPNSLFSTGQTGPMFQQNTQQPSVFGANTPATPSLFGQSNAQPQGNLYNTTPLQAPPSLFNTQAQQTPSLFGPPQAGGTSLLGGVPQTPNFAQALGTAVAASTSGLGPNPYNPNAGFAPNTISQNTGYGQIPSLFSPAPPPLSLTPPTQQVQGDNSNLVNLLAQFCKLLLTQNQPPATGANPAMDALDKYVSNLNQNNPKYSSDPYSQLLKLEQNHSYLDKPSNKTPIYSEEQFQSYQQYFKDHLKQRPTVSNKLYEADQLMNSYRPKNRRDDNIFSTQNLRIVSRKYNGTQQQAKKKYFLNKDQLPKVGEFQISPQLQVLKKMTSQQIHNVKKFTIFNKYGKIQFLEPVSLYKVDLPKSVTISQDNVQITHPELEEKRLRITFNNFGKYTLLDEEGKKRLIKKMKEWISKCGMIQISHDDQNGQLVVQTEEQ